MKGWRRNWKKIWHFIWEDNSIWSWLANIVLAFVLIKYIVYPGLGFLLATTHPVVAVVSESMEHNADFSEWWESSGKWYASNGISKENFYEFPMKGGFNKGDIIVLKGKAPGNIGIGDIVVFWSAKKDPIIHRVVKKWQEESIYYFQTKGDNYKTNPVSIRSSILDETMINQEQIVGNAVLRIPFLGYIKIWFVEFLNVLKGVFAQ
ncbi:signal peptidase I [Candidatus Woesearchaeota archaeon]|nr:signal peptidase I [Candidatus Woesearchaeota archaeon]